MLQAKIWKMSAKQENKKRKRLQNTSTEQYEMYLQFMENDYIFRSNTINPSIEPNYLIKKWEELVEQLNSYGKGPALTVDEWKKRFADWRYATRAKYRKITEHAKKTGAGPMLNLEMTPIEERGLSVWGKVAVDGAQNVTVYEGIIIDPQVIANEGVLPPQDVAPQNFLPPEEIAENIENEDIVEVVYDTQRTPRIEKQQQRLGGERRRVKPLSALAENLIQTSESAITGNAELNKKFKFFCDEYLIIEQEKLELEEQKVELEKEKFKFEIAKFKFLNHGFEYNV